MTSKYKCELCSGEFSNPEDWGEEEREEEADKLWGDLKEAGRASVCDDCFKKIMVLMN